MIASILLTAALLPLRLAPPRPTVGDLVTIRVEAGQKIVHVAPSADQEIVGHDAQKIVFRSFKPGEHALFFSIAGAEGERWQRLDYTVASILPPKPPPPAPLLDPLAPERNEKAVIAIVVAAGVAVAAWGLLIFLWRERKDVRAEDERIDPHVEFLTALDGAAGLPAAAATILTASALRRFSRRVDPSLSEALTTREFLRVAAGRGWSTEHVQMVGRLLHSADRAKFAPWLFEGESIPFAQLRELGQKITPEVAA